MPSARRRREERQIARRLAGLPAFRRAKLVAAYISLSFEVDTRHVLALCRAAKKEIAVPVTFPETGRIRFARLPARGARLKKNVYGIPEPREPRAWVSPREIDLVVV